MDQLPLGGRVVFVDWQGVLSRDLFWTSILRNETHPLRVELGAKLGEIFASDAIAHEWMRGTISSNEIITDMGIVLDRRFRPDFLARRLNDDCIKMHVNAELGGLLSWLRTTAVIVLATDNMDCFVHAFERARARNRRIPERAKTLEDWIAIWDDIVCSSEVGALKAEDPIGFFGPWLSAHGLTFSDALLIDDRVDNCAAFRAQGGATVQWKMGVNDIDEANVSVHQWLGLTAPSSALA